MPTVIFLILARLIENVTVTVGFSLNPLRRCASEISSTFTKKGPCFHRCDNALLMLAFRMRTTWFCLSSSTLAGQTRPTAEFIRDIAACILVGMVDWFD